MQFKWEKGINERMIQNDKEKLAALALMGIYQHKNIQSKEIKPFSIPRFYVWWYDNQGEKEPFWALRASKTPQV